MTDQDLDLCYSSLCEAMARVGEAQAPMLLSMLSLSLLARCGQAGDALPLIAQAERQCGQDLGRANGYAGA